MDAFSQHPDRVGSGTGGRVCDANTNQYYNYRDSSFNTVNMWISGLPDWTPGPGGLAGNSQWFITSCSGGVAEQQLSSAAEFQPELMPNEFYTIACAGKARSRGTRCRDVIFETLFETLWVSNPIRPRSAASRNRVMRGPGVTQGAKRSQGARRPRN